MIRIDFYKTEDANGQDLDISVSIMQAFALPFQDRRVDFGDSFVFLHNVRQQGNRILGEVLRAKMTDVPDKVSRNTGQPQDLGLRADEGIGLRAHFLYDSANHALLFQRERDVRSPAFVQSVTTPIDAEFRLSYIFKGDAMNRLGRMRVLRKLTFKVATPRDPEAFRELDPSAGHAIELLNEMNGRFIDISISVGRNRDAQLQRQNVLRAARGFFGRRGDEVQKILVSGREEVDAATEIIDLFEDRLIYEEQVEPRGRRLDPAECERVLLAAQRDEADYLRRYRHPQ